MARLTSKKIHYYWNDVAHPILLLRDGIDSLSQLGPEPCTAVAFWFDTQRADKARQHGVPYGCPRYAVGPYESAQRM